MELQLQEVVAELAEMLPEASQAQLDELAEQMEAVEERLAALKVRAQEGVVGRALHGCPQATLVPCAGNGRLVRCVVGIHHGGNPFPGIFFAQGREDVEGRVMAAERAYSDLQWRLFELVTAGAADRERRALRSLLFNLTSQRQLLRQVEAQEVLRLRMRSVEQRISALLDEEKQQPAAAAAVAAPPAPRRAQDAGAPPLAALQTVEPPVDGEGAASGQLRLLSAGASMPHAAKAATGGEDAFFLSSLGLGAVGVADGVGGWAAQGVDPSLYPRALVAACQQVLEEASGERRRAGGGGEPPSALAVLQAAYERAQAPGSSTALLAALLPGGRLSVAHLGDCELRVLRGGQVVFSTEVRPRPLLQPAGHGAQASEPFSSSSPCPSDDPPPPSPHAAAGVGAPVEHAAAAQLARVLRLRQPPVGLGCARGGGGPRGRGGGGQRRPVGQPVGGAGGGGGGACAARGARRGRGAWPCDADRPYAARGHAWQGGSHAEAALLAWMASASPPPPDVHACRRKRPRCRSRNSWRRSWRG
jgi:hypothetical protein